MAAISDEGLKEEESGAKMETERLTPRHVPAAALRRTSLNASLSGSGQAPTVPEFLFTEWCWWVDCKKLASINLQRM